MHHWSKGIKIYDSKLKAIGIVLLLTASRLILFGILYFGFYGIVWFINNVISRINSVFALVLLLIGAIILIIIGVCTILYAVIVPPLHIIQSLRLLLQGVPEEFFLFPLNFEYFSDFQKMCRARYDDPLYSKEYRERERMQQEYEAGEEARKERAEQERQRAEARREQAEQEQREQDARRQARDESPLPKTFAEACAVLEVKIGLTKAEYKAAYRKKALEYHSDKFQDVGIKIRMMAEEEMKRINAAWDIIQREMPG